jgi:hypothetical protein
MPLANRIISAAIGVLVFFTSIELWYWPWLMKPGTPLSWWQVSWLAQLGGYLNCVPFWTTLFLGVRFNLKPPFHTILFFALAFAWAALITKMLQVVLRALTSRSTRTPPALPSVLFLLLASSAPLVASVQAGPVSFIR